MPTNQPGYSPSLEDFLARNREEILHSLHLCPMVQVTYADTPREEEHGITKDVFFGVYPRGNVFDVWTLHEDAEESLVWEDSFRSPDLAKKHLLLRASQIQAEKGELLDQQKDVLWAEMKGFLPTHIGPFDFIGNSLRPPSCALEFETDVFEYFEQHSWLLEQDQATTEPHCALYDANGSRCWVAASHRGELVMIPYSQKPASTCFLCLPKQDQSDW